MSLFWSNPTLEKYVSIKSSQIFPWVFIFPSLFWNTSIMPPLPNTLALTLYLYLHSIRMSRHTIVNLSINLSCCKIAEMFTFGKSRRDAQTVSEVSWYWITTVWYGCKFSWWSDTCYMVQVWELQLSVMPEVLLYGTKLEKKSLGGQ